MSSVGSTSFATQSISGLASGLDTASIISALMSIAQQPQAQIQQRITVEQARSQALNDVLSQLQTLTSSYQALTDPSTWADTQTVSSSDDSQLSATRTGGAAAGAYAISVSQLARANQYTASGPSSVAADDVIHIATASGTTDVNVAAGDTLDTVASKINGTSATPVYASVLNGQLVLSNRSTGSAAAITSVTTDGGSGLAFAETQTAQDAQFTIDGKAFTTGSNIVTTALAGVSLTLKTATASPVTVTIGTPAPDTAGIEQKVNAFVTQYNSTLAFITGKLDEQVVPNASTDADRIKGVLNGDPGLEGLMGSLRNAFSDLVSGAPSGYQSLVQVGVSTGASTGSGPLSSDSIDGKLVFDQSKFETALASDFADVKKLFTNATGAYTTEGIGQRLNGILSPWTASAASNGILQSRIQGEATTITDLQQESADWDQRLALKQQMLQGQFTAMETALSQAQSQSQWLDAQLKQLGG